MIASSNSPSAFTVAVTSGRPSPEEGNPLNFPVALASNFHGSAYSRCDGTDTTNAFESAVATLEQGRFGVSFSSGMAAVAGVFEALSPKVVVLPRVCYLSVREIARQQEASGRWIVRSVDMTDLDQVLDALAMEPKCDLLWIESPSNPLVQVADVPRLCSAAAKAGIFCCVDATFASPVAVVKPLNLGAHLVMHSATKYIGGHSDLLMGIVVCNDESIHDKLKTVRLVHGAVPGSLETFLALRGIRTLPLRFERQQQTSRIIAEKLGHHEAVDRVYYPGTGAMISFDVKGGAECADATVAAAQLIIRATSLGGVESSFERRAKYSSEQGVAGPGLIRFSVGLEDAVDIWLDLSFSLAEGQRRRCAVRLGKEAWKTSLIACEPAAQVQSGDIVEFVTSDDNYEKLSRGERVDLETVNVVTGPVKICDAQVGDAIRVDVLDVKIHRCWSVWSSDKKCCGCLAAKRAAAGHEKASVRELGIRDKFVVISERLQVPLRPMIGVIATASKDPKLASTFEPTYPNGGNMDLRQLEPGASIFLPVLVDGGLLFVGDLHAAMGEGEPTWVGFESAGTAVLRLSLVRNTPLPFPRLLLSNDRIVFTALASGAGIGSDISPHDEAMQHALGQAYDHLLEVEKLTPEEAFGFLTAQAAATFGGPASRQALVTIESPKRFFINK